jgi:hypothetical protein
MSIDIMGLTLHDFLNFRSNHNSNSITTYELCHVLKEYFGVVVVCCCDLIQRMEIELDMYCPDQEHLYFIEA